MIFYATSWTFYSLTRSVSQCLSRVSGAREEWERTEEDELGNRTEEAQNHAGEGQWSENGKASSSPLLTGNIWPASGIHPEATAFDNLERSGSATLLMYPDAAPASPGLTKNQPDAEASNVTGRKRQRQPVTTPYNGQMQLELPLVLKTDEKKRAVYMSFLKRLLTKVVSLFYSHEKGGPDNAGANLTTAPWTGAARKGLTISILLAGMCLHRLCHDHLC